MIKFESRESDDVINAIVSTPIWEGIPITIERFERGDIIFSYKNRKKQWVDAFAWESKTWSDLINSLTKDKSYPNHVPRLVKQLTQLQATFPQGAGLLVKGRLETWSWDVDPLDRRVKLGGRETEWTVKNLRGFLLSCKARGIIVEEVQDVEELPYYLRAWHNHFITHRLDTDHFARGATIPTAMLDMIPTIGPDKAQKLWKDLGNDRGSLETLFVAKEADFIKSIGPISGREAYARFH